MLSCLNCQFSEPRLPRLLTFALQVCMEHQRTHACIPCGHMAYCAECVRTLDDHHRRHCCICRARVASICRIYQA